PAAQSRDLHTLPGLALCPFQGLADGGTQGDEAAAQVRVLVDVAREFCPRLLFAHLLGIITIGHGEAEQTTASPARGRAGHRPPTHSFLEITPAAIGVLAVTETRLHTLERVLDRQTIAASHPQSERGELCVGIIAADFLAAFAHAFEERELQ